jgi:hypothetical protein
VAVALGRAFKAQVDIGNFRSTYFPFPGCVAERITFRGKRVEGSIQKLTIQADYSTMLTFQSRLARIRGDGLRIRILSHDQAVDTGGTDKGSSKNAKLVVDEVVADASVLEVERKNPGQPPLRFQIHELKVDNVGVDRAMRFRTALTNPEPPGEVRCAGSFGPWVSNHPGEIPVSGSYTFAHADLGVFHVIRGTLSSKGKFNGVVKRLDVQGSVKLPDFEVTSSGHREALRTDFHATVNGTNGDVELHPADSNFEKTSVLSVGGILGKPGQHGKTITMEMTSHQGHIQDLMRMFMKSKRPPMEGVVSLRAHVVVPPTNAPFLKKLQLVGDFGIEGNYTNPTTQKKVDIVSERARGDKHNDADPENVIDDLKGHVVVRNGVATFTNASFRVPGAVAHLAGTYNLLNERVDLSGTLAMQADLSQATKGVKSFLLKALDPFFKRKHAGAVVPIQITGTYEHPQYGISLNPKKAKRLTSAD